MKIIKVQFGKKPDTWRDMEKIGINVLGIYSHINSICFVSLMKLIISTLSVRPILCGETKPSFQIFLNKWEFYYCYNYYSEDIVKWDLILIKELYWN